MAERTTSPWPRPPYPEDDWDTATQSGDLQSPVRPDNAHTSTETQRQPSPNRSSHGRESGEQTDFDGNMPDFVREKTAELAGPPVQADVHLVQFADGDPGNPKNWSKAYKW